MSILDVETIYLSEHFSKNLNEKNSNKINYLYFKTIYKRKTSMALVDTYAEIKRKQLKWGSEKKNSKRTLNNIHTS